MGTIPSKGATVADVPGNANLNTPTFIMSPGEQLSMSKELTGTVHPLTFSVVNSEKVLKPLRYMPTVI